MCTVAFSLSASAKSRIPASPIPPAAQNTEEVSGMHARNLNEKLTLQVDRVHSVVLFERIGNESRSLIANPIIYTVGERDR